jgi:hypothetical protein
LISLISPQAFELSLGHATNLADFAKFALCLDAIAHRTVAHLPLVPHSQPGMPMMNLSTKITLAMLVLIGMAGCAQQTRIGSDRDEYGCIPSAGYVWNQEKQACIRPWEHQ